MLYTTKFRDAIRQEHPKPLENTTHTQIAGRFVDHHVHLRTCTEQAISKHKPFVNSILTHLEISEQWHHEALLDIFTSELATDMSNNLADYVHHKLLPYRYEISILPPRPARTQEILRHYVSSFPSSQRLLMHIFATELQQHFTENEEHEALVFHNSVWRKPISERPLAKKRHNTEQALLCEMNTVSESVTIQRVVNIMAARSEIHSSQSPCTDRISAIVDTAYTELLYALRQHKATKFSISDTTDHSVALCTPVSRPTTVIQKIQTLAPRMTKQGYIRPSMLECVSILLALSASTVFFTLGVIYNWAGRDNTLERIFDGVGLFGVTSGVLLAIISRRLDFHDLLSIMLRKNIYIDSYGKLLEMLDVTESELKCALTFEGVHVAPLSRNCTSYAFEQHDGFFNTFSGLDTRENGMNIIVGNETAVARGMGRVRYFSRVHHEGVSFLKERSDAGYRMVTKGDEKVVK